MESYYNGDQLETFNSLVEKFNTTTGKEKGIQIESQSQGSVSDLEQNVMDAAQKKVGASEMPNIFSAYADTAYTLDQMGMVVDLGTYMTGRRKRKIHFQLSGRMADFSRRWQISRSSRWQNVLKSCF